MGSDASPVNFVEADEAEKPDVVALSALLTTTMLNMISTLDALREAGLRDQVKVMIGGAPVTEEYAHQIGADGFANDASRAVTIAKALLESLIIVKFSIISRKYKMFSIKKDIST